MVSTPFYDGDGEGSVSAPRTSSRLCYGIFAVVARKVDGVANLL